MLELVRSIEEMQDKASALRDAGQRIGAVPTMGALHEGHLSLMRLCRQHADVVVTTLFVNPAQFGVGEDFDRYPRELERDTRRAAEAGTDILFVPDRSMMYPAGYVTYVTVEKITERLEGRSRPGHFRGVTTVVVKLFHTVRPHVAVFGQKDAQQVAVIRRMVRDLNFDVRLVIAPTVREPDGLAMSSRNVFLTEQQRAEAPVLYRALRAAEDLMKGGERRCDVLLGRMREMITARSSGVIDYLSIADEENLDELSTISDGRGVLMSLAVMFGTTRLIDNIVVRC
jgi:pantoate--beta-alanine ligase